MDFELEHALDVIERHARQECRDYGHPDHADCTFQHVGYDAKLDRLVVRCEHGEPLLMPQEDPALTAVP